MAAAELAHDTNARVPYTADWLLIYKTSETEVLLARTGTHADLFKGMSGLAARAGEGDHAVRIK